MRALWLLLLLATSSTVCAATMERVALSPDRRGFVLQRSGARFTPWGFNYDHDDAGVLLEDYWDRNWSAIKGDFAEMRSLGANVVRVHLQFGRFMETPTRPRARSLRLLSRLLAVAEQNRLYIDLTGLGCYHKADTPAWYDAMDEEGRWSAQCAFWKAVARTCARSPALFCYDLMNEPVVPGGKRDPGDWLGPPFAGSCFVQCISLDQAGRERPDIARKWIHTLASAIRSVDRTHLITVGMVDWSPDRPGLTSGFVPAKVAGDLDFLCVHLYPDTKRPEAVAETLRLFEVGKPVVIEETFPLACTMSEYSAFLAKEGRRAAGCISFYWGVLPRDLRKRPDLSSAVVAEAIDTFLAARPAP